MNQNFSVRIAALDEAVVLELAGDVDGSSQELGRAYDQATAEGGGAEVILDFTKVDYINSSGIALIVSVLAKARAAGRRVVAVGLSPHYRQIFEITRLSDFIELRAELGGKSHPPAQVSGRNHAAAEG
ncbi:MAG: STAS domain-containing protein [Candidatus Dormibacteria bacterium]